MSLLCRSLWLLFFLPLLAGAELGGSAASIEADRVQMKAVVRAQPAASYTVHEIRDAGGLVVREYLSASGRVFAVGWNGPRIPDLRQLLGGYFPTLQSAAQARPGRHGPLHVQRPDLVVTSSGHQRFFAGFAYAPALVPAGVSPESLH
ncbi:MAG: DUF2844 domain-containing protein [Betaproteobacteria bacterium]|nr:DUF2844 domain-containing protein [Betaproteobacteria bacterium]